MDETGFFNTLRNAGKLKDIFKGAADLKGKLERLNEELAARTVEGEAGAGAVRVVMNGKMQVIEVRLDGPLIASLSGGGSEADQRMVEELVAGAFNAASARAREMISEELRRATGGLDIPGLSAMMGGS